MGKIKVGVVTARWNQEITSKLEEGAISYLEACEDVEIFAALVPGAVEIPLACQAFLEAGCDGVVALGVVIRGDTSHYDYVCNSVTDGVTRLMLDYKKPIGFGVLTTENEEQALARAGGDHGNKGEEAAQVTMEMIGLTQEIPAAMKTALMLAKKAPAKAAKKPAKAAAKTQKKKKKVRK
ncbi:6,7-dimethyl-8-ribityllumazine synthase [Bdellovibrio bacteriovorus]|uniref:6,7-dimethyl-8-ribityllumazine synthase n=1 Tax=Bdellovibrio bacteriovorus (strain ATCC 15356 / DSM 50701 / NCIMB 9529 / HD100) TaxID=264462 RepID=RISB_BDEBA|nr:6,7-dimethyl-8-ribityllumazine synthase [Bdellovibrio bacteriovorus]P61720.1 RecName: Full=6,7-dimethyl-8-ribityllumazine synthase; Short=DMRL synthase; Short=LS; Short=Lumazine synthase [Bdellovibrio bacteriovorus HD100]AHZ83432.1 6,7-dimethyl-8-ribityllumazine synthase [Bdellovibrio bacteriovorus]BEV69401.1 6,7-dimethyl-8-ribityllumazine synthase [Bdellovibrio bacteriovorus]CAE80804.1 riboflavin synthase beta chain [Bdellovibrio bacteriovorus HD100]